MTLVELTDNTTLILIVPICLNAGFNNYKITETAIKTLGRKERYVMVIHNGLILAPDFLYFMSQLVTVADVDQSIMGISAWNINGNDTTLEICPDSSLLGFLLFV